MSGGRVRIAHTEDLAAVRRLGVACEPRALTKRIDGSGPAGGPRSEWETWRDRD